MKELRDLFTELKKARITQEDISSIRLKDTPDSTEEDSWIVVVQDQKGEQYSAHVVVDEDMKEHCRKVAHVGIDFEGTLVDEEAVRIVQ